tara:strand:+ start:231 stop:497 length:267 start_codon:yes stop_codon:yes gene_type:complete
MYNKPKYEIGQKVLIDKLFTTENNIQGQMEILEEVREAIVLEVEPRSSLGPCYKIEWVDSSLEKPRIKYWESDILGPANTTKNTNQEA